MSGLRTEPTQEEMVLARRVSQMTEVGLSLLLRSPMDRLERDAAAAELERRGKTPADVSQEYRGWTHSWVGLPRASTEAARRVWLEYGRWFL